MDAKSGSSLVRTITLIWFLFEGVLGLWSLRASFDRGTFWPSLYIGELIIAWVLLMLWLKRKLFDSVPYEQRWMTAYLLGWVSLMSATNTLFDRIFTGPTIDYSTSRALVEKSISDYHSFETNWLWIHLAITLTGIALIGIHFQLKKKLAAQTDPVVQP